MFCAPGGVFYQLSSSISSKDMYSLHGNNFYLHIYHLYQDLTSEVPVHEIALWLKQTGHSKIQILIYTTSGISASRLNHVIPFLIISGYLFISLLTFIFPVF